MLQTVIDLGTLKAFGLNIPLRIHGYGLMMVLGFLLAILLAMWRARRCGEHPDAIANCGLLALIGGVVGARIAYLIQPSVWKSFTTAPNPLASMIDITSGGLVYYGGVILAVILTLGYLRLKRLAIRRHLDILAVSLMIGLAFGRMGCMLNGCCFGGRCDEHWAPAHRFPMFSEPLWKLGGNDNPFSEGAEGPSPLYAHQLEQGLVDPDPRLLFAYGAKTIRRNGRLVTQRVLHPPRYLHGRLDRDQLTVILGDRRQARQKFNRLAGPDGRLCYAEWKRGLAESDGLLRGSEFWDEAMHFDSDMDGQLSFPETWSYLGGYPGAKAPNSLRERVLMMFDEDRDGELSSPERASANDYLQADLVEIASASWSKPAKPAQALGIANALVVALILSLFYRLRTREGQVFALLMIVYPVTRFVLESIRGDNPHDVLTGVLTHNQYTSLVIFAAGVIMWAALRKAPASAGPTWFQRPKKTRHHPEPKRPGKSKTNRR